MTVFSETKSRSPISRLLKPSAMSPRISCSRGVIPSSLSFPASTTNGPPGSGTRTSLITVTSRDRARPLQPEVDPQRGEDRRHQAAVDLARVRADDVLVFEDLEQGEEHPAGQPIEDDAFHGREHNAPGEALAGLVLQFPGSTVS